MNRHDGGRRRVLAAGAAWVVAAGAPAARAAAPSLVELTRPGRVLMLRHAQAPGFGDPPGFRLGDCSTQRNLDDGGRAQAARLGKRLAGAGVTRAKVYSSQWCRCLETARLLGLGAVAELPALNSFFDRPEERERRIGELRAFLATLPRDAPLVVLVTHQVTISAITGRGTAAGAGVAFELDSTGVMRELGAIDAD